MQPVTHTCSHTHVLILFKKLGLAAWGCGLCPPRVLPTAGAASGSDSNARSAPRPAAPEHLGRCSWGPRKVRALSLSPDCRLSPSLRGRPASSRMASVFRKEGSGQSPRPGRAHWPCPDPQAGRATHKRGHVSAPPHLRGPLPSKTTTTEMFSF